MGKGFEHFSTEDIQTSNKYMKKCSTLLVMKEMQSKTIMRYFTPSRMAMKKKILMKKISVGEDIEKLEPSLCCQ